MKKPPYIRLELPGVKVPYHRSILKYFNSPAGKVLKLSFGEKRYRKEFEYIVVGASEQSSWKSSRPATIIEISLKQKEISPEI